MLFKIERDRYKFKELNLEVSDFVESLPESVDHISANEFSSRNISLLPTWKMLKTTFSPIEGHENLTPDICTWIDATLLLSPEAKDKLGDTLALSGEFLPLIIDNKQYEIFNCLTLRESIEGSEELIFKTADSHSLHLYCGKEFKDLVTEFKLQGIIFTSN
jgi:hypothetical protein